MRLNAEPCSFRITHTHTHTHTYIVLTHSNIVLSPSPSAVSPSLPLSQRAIRATRRGGVPAPHRHSPRLLLRGGRPSHHLPRRRMPPNHQLVPQEMPGDDRQSHDRNRGEPRTADSFECLDQWPGDLGGGARRGLPVRCIKVVAD